MTTPPFSAARPLRGAWAALALLAGLNIVNYLDRYVMSAVLGPMRVELHLDYRAAGLAASAFMLGYFLSAPIFGYLGDRYPRKFLMLGGVIVWSIATAATGLTHSFVALYAVRIVVGVGEACFVSLGPSWISDLFPAARRNTALTLFYVAVPFGSAIGFTVGGWFAQRGDWRDAFFFAGVPGVLLALALLFLREPSRGEADGVVENAPHRATLGEVLGLLLNRRYNLLIWGYTAQVFVLGGFALWGPTFLQEVHGFSPGAASSLFGEILAGTGLVATLVGGGIANFLRRRLQAGYVWLMAVSILLAAPVCLFALTVESSFLSLAGLGAAMFLLFLPTGPISSEIFEIVPLHLRASAMALCTFMIHLFGDWTSPALVGQVADWTGGLRDGVLILPAMLLVGAVLWGVLIFYTGEKEKSKRRKVKGQSAFPLR